jgi:hypothetical protein
MATAICLPLALEKRSLRAPPFRKPLAIIIERIVLELESAGLRRKRRALDPGRLPLRPPAAPSSHTPLGKSIPRLIKSSTHLRARFLKKAL